MNPKDKWTSFPDPDANITPDGPNWVSDPRAGTIASDEADKRLSKAHEEHKKALVKKIEDENIELKNNLKAALVAHYKEYPSASGSGMTPMDIVSGLSINRTKVTDNPKDRVPREKNIQKGLDAIKHLSMYDKDARDNPNEFLKKLLESNVSETRVAILSLNNLRKMTREVVSEIDGSRFGRQFISPSDPNPAPLGVNDPDPMFNEDDLDMGDKTTKNNFPFDEFEISPQVKYRSFSRDTLSEDLTWHRDADNRIVRVVEGNGWMLQLDNEMPVSMDPGSLHAIPAGVWHRVIMSEGASDLSLLVKSVTHQQLAEAKKKRKKKSHPSQYSAPEGSKRDRQLDATQDDLKSGDAERKKRAYRRREEMEEKERKKPGFRNVPRPDSQKNESIELDETWDLIEELIEEALSKKTKETLKKKAEKRGLTPGSVYAEYRKGLAAWATSGSRKGMSQHQWAMARVNSANPSKSWAVVKKSKKKKKKSE